MKAIRQIIDYLRQRGELSTGQMSELASLGLIEWDDVAEPDGRSALDILFGAIEEPATPPAVAEPEEEIPSRRPAGAKGRGRRRKPADLSPRELCRRLATFFAQAEPKLAGMVPLARLVAECADGPAAAIVLRQATVQQVAAALERGLRTRVLSLAALWDFLAEEEFRTVLPDAQLQGPVGVAYRALLAAGDAANLGRYAGLLRHEEVQKLFNLRMAQRQVVRAWAALYDHRPELIGQLLQREHHWLAYWAMVILYTARRGKAGSYPPPAAHEVWPKRPFPTVEQMYRAWAHAAFMDPLAVLPLLQAHEARPKDPRTVCWNLRDGCVAGLPEAARDRVISCEQFDQLAATDWARMTEVWPLVEDHYREHFSRAGVFLFLHGHGARSLPEEIVYALLLVGSWYSGWTRLSEPQFTRYCFLCPQSWERYSQRFAK